jgi:hypothetical protein
MARFQQSKAVKTISRGREKPLYLNWSTIQPGDVLLTRGKGSTSIAIAKASGGPYSHAAVVVEPQTLFESDDVGVGYSVYKIDRVEKNGQDRILLSRLTDIRDAVVLRYPGVDHKSATKICKKLRNVLRPIVGTDYPKWKNLASAARGGLLGQAFASVILHVLDVINETDIKNPGPFCSELVCAAFRDAGIECFEPPRAPKTVGPNDFLISKLKKVEGLVRPADKSAATDDLYLQGLNNVSVVPRKRQTGAAVNGLRGIADIGKAANAIHALRIKLKNSEKP